MSDIRSRTEEIREATRAAGGYQRFVYQGLSYHWIQKFACGVIKNPTVENVARLEAKLKELGADSHQESSKKSA